MQSAAHQITRFLSRSDAQLLRNLKIFLFDCDGVIWKGAQPVPGSVETLNYLKQIGKSVYYLVLCSARYPP